LRLITLNASYVVMIKAYLASDHVTAATGKTIAITLSKVGGAFANPSVGATNATEVSNGWYSVTLSSADTDTLGDLVMRGAEGTIDDAEQIMQVSVAIASVSDIPTPNANADALLDRDMSIGTDSGSTTVRTVRQALRFLRNKWSISGTTLSVYKEDDTTASWTTQVTGTAGADPVTSSDPAGP